MSRHKYTLITFRNIAELEKYERRSAFKLLGITSHISFHSADATDAWGTPLLHTPNIFELYTGQTRIFRGDIGELTLTLRKLI